MKNHFGDFIIVLMLVAFVAVCAYIATRPLRTHLNNATKQCNSKDGTMLATRTGNVCIQNSVVIKIET